MRLAEDFLEGHKGDMSHCCMQRILRQDVCCCYVLPLKLQEEEEEANKAQPCLETVSCKVTDRIICKYA